MKLSAWLLSLTLLWATGCSPTRNLQKVREVPLNQLQVTRPFDVSEGLVYKAGVDLYDHHFSGFFMIRQTEERQYRVVFTSEMGVKLFDLLFDKQAFEVVYCFEKLDRKAVIKRLRRDLRMLFMVEYDGRERAEVYRKEGEKNKILKLAGEDGWNYYFLDEASKRPVHMENTGLFKVRAVASLGDHQEGVPREIVIDHKEVDLKLRLEQVRNTNDQKEE